MQGLEDVLAVSGFWLCMILLVFRGPIKEWILKKPDKNTTEITELKTRLQALEGRIAVMNTEILELREVQDFDKRLSAASGTATSARTPTTSPVGAGRLKLPQK